MDASPSKRARGFLLRYGWRFGLGLIVAGTVYLGLNEGRWGPLVYSLVGATTGWAIAAITWEVARRTYERD